MSVTENDKKSEGNTMHAGNPGALTRLKEKISHGSVRVGIYGLGYVGLPLALRFAEVGIKVVGFDIDEAKVRTLGESGSYCLLYTSPSPRDRG